MNSGKDFSVTWLAVAGLISLVSGCATSPKQMAPVATPTKADLLKEMEVVQEPALEPEWADFVKQHYPSWQRHYWVDRGQWGNRGYLVGKAETPATAPVPATVSALPLTPVEPPTIVAVEPPAAIAATPQENRPTTYVVKKGDSLWKIAGKVYGNPLKWTRLYKANKQKLKSANKIYPGQVLNVPWE